jgi:hypothetical protein
MYWIRDVTVCGDLMFEAVGSKQRPSFVDAG